MTVAIDRATGKRRGEPSAAPRADCAPQALLPEVLVRLRDDRPGGRRARRPRAATRWCAASTCRSPTPTASTRPARSASTRSTATYKFIGLDNYADILWGPTAYDRFWSHFIWTVVWTAACVALHYSIGLGLALLLNQKLRGRTFYRLILVLPWAVPTFVTVFGWRFMLADGGVINSALDALHLPTPLWLEDTFWQRFAAIMVNTWCGVPFMMVSLLGGLQSIDATLYEAAEMDGASAWQRFRYVTLPGLRSVSSTVVLLGVIWTFNQFAVIFLLFGDTAPRRADPRDLGVLPRLRPAAARLRAVGGLRHPAPRPS